MIKNFLDYASSCYYAGQPIITDDEFDRLAEEHNYEYVGASVRDGVSHTYPMYSLKKSYVGEKQIELNGETVETPKLDGAAVSLLYVGGKFVLGLTRGDGQRGQDVTKNLRHLVPNQLNHPNDFNKVIQITGEVVAPKSIANARNYAAGALSLQDETEFKSRELYFVAYSYEPTNCKTYTQSLGLLYESGFTTVRDSEFANFPQDGKVIRLNNNEAFINAGYTSNHPKGAYALKERGEGVKTTLLDVIWQVGRSGVVSPVAILKPVVVGGATVARATLHNYKYIMELGLELGCEVEIIRAGEIIPRVVKRVDT
jgi:NAD-dependent DNA ligase